VRGTQAAVPSLAYPDNEHCAHFIPEILVFDTRKVVSIKVESDLNHDASHNLLIVQLGSGGNLSKPD
jgi:predicted solute-binding protein